MHDLTLALALSFRQANPPIYRLEGEVYSVRQHNFDHIGESVASLFVMWTAENYPDVVKPALGEAGALSIFEVTLFYFLFFVYLLVMFFVLLPIVVASVFEYNKDFRADKIIKDQFRSVPLSYYASAPLYYVLPLSTRRILANARTITPSTPSSAAVTRTYPLLSWTPQGEERTAQGIPHAGPGESYASLTRHCHAIFTRHYASLIRH